jgi:hypothetical protein
MVVSFHTDSSDTLYLLSSLRSRILPCLRPSGFFTRTTVTSYIRVMVGKQTESSRWSGPTGLGRRS